MSLHFLYRTADISLSKTCIEAQAEPANRTSCRANQPTFRAIGTDPYSWCACFGWNIFATHCGPSHGCDNSQPETRADQHYTDHQFVNLLHRHRPDGDLFPFD
jgi:hypothetical protein